MTISEEELYFKAVMLPNAVNGEVQCVLNKDGSWSGKGLGKCERCGCFTELTFEKWEDAQGLDYEEFLCEKCRRI